MSGTETSHPDTPSTEAELVVGGMTCGACAARIERRLNRLDGVAATVNYATGRAYFASTGGRDPAELIGVIESAGYTAEPPAPPSPDGQQHGPADPGAGPAARGLRPAGRGGHRAVHGPGRAVPRLAVGEPAAGRAGRDLGRLAAVPGRLVRARPRRRHHGHPGQRGRRRVVLLVGVRAAVRRRGRDRDEDVVRLHLRPGQRGHAVPGGRRRGDRGGAGRAVPGGPGAGTGRAWR